MLRPTIPHLRRLLRPARRVAVREIACRTRWF